MTLPTCAVCWGAITTAVNTLWWEGHALDLCEGCFILGMPGLELSAEEVEMVLGARANPAAPRTGFEDRIEKWLSRARGPHFA